MKLLPLAFASLACLFVVGGSRTDKNVSASGEEIPLTEAQRKRDTGYSYARPSRFSSSGERIHGRIVVKGPEASRPFARYGPPRQQSGGFKLTSSSNRPQQNLHIYVEDSSSGQAVRSTQQRVPSPSREREFAEASPIAGQNNLPFNSKFANYLPPRNQKLPGHTSPPYSFANDHQLSKFQNHQSPDDHQRQISDAAAFLAENSRAISQLYQAPAADINYEPTGDEAHEISKNFNENIGKLNPIENLPSYASGYVDHDTLKSIKSLEKDRLIKQLQHELVDVRAMNLPQFDSRYLHNNNNNDNNNNNNNVENQRNALGQNSRLNPRPEHPINHLNRHRQYGIDHQASTSPATTSGYTYDMPATPSTIPSSTIASTLLTDPANQRPQASAGHPTSQTGSGQPSTSLQFPQFTGGFVPSLLPNYFAGYPLATIGGVITSGSSNVNNLQTSAPTHFGIPIPTISTFVQKPDSTVSHYPQNPLNYIPAQSLNPITNHPVQPFPLVPAAGVAPIHQATENPATTNIIGHPSYGVQSAINQLHLKPIKTIYPLYYYHHHQNVYQLQKPGLATLPWNYAPSYSQPIRPDQAWK